MVRPKINKIKADIKNCSIYLRSTKKFGKTSLFRDVIIEKYGDPSRGLLIGCGSEQGYAMLDNINAVQVTTYDELVELVDWLVAKKGIEHNIEICAFDTADELVLITDAETIRIHNKDNPTKKVKSIKAAMSGYSAGEKYSANNLIKPLMNKIKAAGIGVWVISHTKFKNIKQKGTTELDGWMQLTSCLGADYESAFGDCMDVVLTGVVDKPIIEKEVGDETKRFVNGETVRKLYFRETELIDAGGRFSYGTVPDYMIFDKPNMAADFIRVIEEGMEKSKTVTASTPTSKIPQAKIPVALTVPEEKAEEPEETPTIQPTPADVEETAVETDDVFSDTTNDVEELRATIKETVKTVSSDKKAEAVKFIKENGGKVDALGEAECLKVLEILS